MDKIFEWKQVKVDYPLKGFTRNGYELHSPIYKDGELVLLVEMKPNDWFLVGGRLGIDLVCDADIPNSFKSAEEAKEYIEVEIIKIFSSYYFDYERKFSVGDNIVNKDIQIKYFDNEIDKIHKIEKGDWIDLRAAETVTLKAGEFKLIPLGVGMILPEGYEAHVIPRSSTFKKYGVIQTNHLGLIDESYCGDNDQWMFPAYALRDTTINKNERICQFRIVKKQPTIQFVEVEHLRDNDRGGFGSTGSK